MVKLLIVGDNTYDIYARAFYEAACRTGQVRAHFFHYGKMNLGKMKGKLIRKAEFHFRTGPDVYAVNRKLIKKCREERYDLVFLYSAVLIFESTVRRIKEMGCFTAVYCNDDPFSNSFRRFYWKNVRNSVRHADMVYSYRPANIKRYYRWGAKNVKLLLPYYIESRNYFIEDSQIQMDVPDVVFIGHREDDNRDEYIRALLDHGIKVGLNDHWSDFESGSPLITILPSDMNQYNLILNKCRIALVFLSGINNDTYTRRCFEIPIVKTLMIAPYNHDLAEMFQDGIEAVLYKDKDDFVKKVQYYLKNDEECEKIARAGYTAVKEGKNEAADRIRQILSDYRKLNRSSANMVFE